MKYFISYRHTGAEGPRLDGLQQVIKQAFTKRGDEFYSTYFRQDEFNGLNMDYTAVLKHVLGLIDTMDALFVLLDSEEKSEGMLIEIGYCIAKNIKVVVAVNRAVTCSQIPGLADEVITYGNLADLKRQIIDMA